MKHQFKTMPLFQAYAALTDLSRYFRNLVRPKLAVLKNLSLGTQMSSLSRTLTKWVNIKSLGAQFVAQNPP